MTIMDNLRREFEELEKLQVKHLIAFDKIFRCCDECDDVDNKLEEWYGGNKQGF